MTSLSLIAAVGAALLSATPLPAAQAQSVRVSHADLDLSSHAVPGRSTRGSRGRSDRFAGFRKRLACR